MFKIKNTEQFKKSFEQIAIFIDECNIHINDDGLTIKAFDSAQMLYIEYNLSAEGLDGDLDSNVFGINISEMNKILGKLSQDDIISMDFTQYELQLIIEGEYKRVYTFPLKELEEKDLEINVNDYPVLIDEKATIQKDIFSSSKVVADSVLFDCKKDKIVLSADGLYGRYNTEIATKSSQEFQTKFSSTHLYNMIKNVDSNAKIIIKLSPQQPLYLSYQLGNNTLKYFLAHMFV